jgi:hypothetical protein
MKVAISEFQSALRGWCRATADASPRHAKTSWQSLYHVLDCGKLLRICVFSLIYLRLATGRTGARILHTFTIPLYCNDQD